MGLTKRGATFLAALSATASLGMPEATEVSSYGATATATTPTAFGFKNRSAPSSCMPVMTARTASAPAYGAAEGNGVSTFGRRTRNRRASSSE